MSFFLLAFLAGLGVICSLAGWGWALTRALRLRSDAGIGTCAASGLALSTSVGAILNLFHWITPGAIRLYLLAGLLLALAAGLLGSRKWISRIGAVSLHSRRAKAIALGSLLLVTATLGKYSSVVSPGEFHLQDDYHAYFAFPVMMVETGSLVSEPFSERSVISSLGGQSFLDTFLLATTKSVRTLRLLDEGVGFLILLLLLAEIAIRSGIPIPWTLLFLFAASVFPAPLSNITAVYTGIALLILLFDVLDREVSAGSLRQALFLAIVLASLTSLKSTFAPMAGIFFLIFFGVQSRLMPSKAKTLARAALCGALVMALLTPWMLHSYRSSGTLFYPIFGRGFHGSRYGVYLLPTADMGWHNVLAFANGLSNIVGALLAIQACFFLWICGERGAERRTALLVLANLAVDVAVIGLATGGVQMYRYSFAILFACLLALLLQQLKVFAAGSRPAFPTSSVAGVAALLSVGMFFGAAWNGFINETPERLQEIGFALTDRNIVSRADIAAYQTMQSAIPPGQKALVRLDKNFLLDFRRNAIYFNDLPGGASLPPGIPIFQGPEALADYLVHHGIRYLAYSYGDEATFSRKLFSDRLAPAVNVWLRRGAQIAFDFQDNAVALGRSRRRVYDDGKMFMLDLETPADQAAPGSSAPIPPRPMPADSEAAAFALR